ncbi:MAG: N-acetylmuramoyl-L-alanine amidase [Clostridia bacterium]|nr:N-acetylmuramoyl-L-alanine amidase [Clostridia bacterium]
MARTRNFGKISLILIIIAAVIVASIFGLSYLIRRLSSDAGHTSSQNNTGPDNAMPGNQEIKNGEIILPEDIESIIEFRGDVLSLTNPGKDYRYSVKTGVYKFEMMLGNRATDKIGIFSVQGGDFFKSYEISEESEGVRITASSETPFTIVESMASDTLELSFVPQKNLQKLVYSNDMDRVHLHIDKGVLSNESDSEIKYYSEKYDADTNTRTILIEKKYLPPLHDDRLVFNDGTLDYIDILNFDGYVQLKFALGDESVVIYPNTRDYDAVFTFIKPNTDGLLIVLDPGHGGIDGGAVSADGGIIEKDIVMSIGKMLKLGLIESGYKVYNLREEDAFLGLKERTDIANLLGANAIISIHINSYTDPGVSGTVTLYKDSYDLASLIQQEVVGRIYSANMGAVQKTDLSILNRALMDAVIVETGFVTNVMEAAKLSDPEYQLLIAKGIEAGINLYYGKGGD